MESTCPHLSAPLAHAPFLSNDSNDSHTDISSSQPLNLDDEIADMEDITGLQGDQQRATRTIVCPWHKYDFSLLDGSSGTGLSVCVYDVKVLVEESEEKWAYIEAPDPTGGEGKGSGKDWQVVELRGVSEEFADPPVLSTSTSTSTSTPVLTSESSSTTPPTNNSIAQLPLTPSSTPTLPPSSTLPSLALLILQTPSPLTKLHLTRLTTAALKSGSLTSIRPTSRDTKAAKELFESDQGRWVPPREGMKSVEVWDVKKRGKGGNEKSRVLMLHALANIEQWAVDLAWDIIARFGSIKINGKPLPVEFFLDFARMAEDEAKHFSLLSQRLRELGSYYGAHSIHASLWDTALETSHSLSSRLAIIHLVAEARGLDVNPLTIEKFRKAGDMESVRVLDIIHGDEITHVTTGHRWFTWLCQQTNVDPIDTFRNEVRANFRGKLKGPFNESDRLRAGMSREYYEDLEGRPWKYTPAPSDGDKDGDGEKKKEVADGDLRIHPRLT